MKKLIAETIKKLSKTVILAGGLTLSISAFSLGIGDIQLHSKLGEPLSAQLSLSNAANLSNDEIIIRQAPIDIYKQLGVETSTHHSRLTFSINPDHSISITTREIIKEPFLNFVVELRWPEGQLYREYKLLFDPK